MAKSSVFYLCLRGAVSPTTTKASYSAKSNPFLQRCKKSPIKLLLIRSVGLTCRICEEQITESVFKTACANSLVQAWSLISLFMLFARAWLVRLDFASAVCGVFASIPVVVRNVFLSFKEENVEVQAD